MPSIDTENLSVDKTRVVAVGAAEDWGGEDGIAEVEHVDAVEGGDDGDHGRKAKEGRLRVSAYHIEVFGRCSCDQGNCGKTPADFSSG